MYILVFFLFDTDSRIEALQGDSDHSPFYYYMGIPSFSPAYMYNPKVGEKFCIQGNLCSHCIFTPLVQIISGQILKWANFEVGKIFFFMIFYTNTPMINGQILDELK